VEPAPDRDPLDISEAIPALAGDGWRARVREALDRLLGLDQIRANFLHGKSLPVDQYAGAFQAFGLELNLPDFQLPGIGPLMIVANHPFGGADALSLGMACRAQRPDCLMLGNKLASEFPGIGEVTLPLYIMGQEDAARKNASTLRKALGHLKGGGSLCVFPSGEVAHWRGASVEESPWSHHIASWAQRSEATVIPVHFLGKCPAWFHALGCIHPMLRTATLPRLLLMARGRTVEARVGNPISARDFKDVPAEEFVRHLRRATLEIRD
jgi:putative hemolysin